MEKLYKPNQIEWENLYSRNGDSHKNKYPSDLVVGWVKRNFSAFNKKEMKCLDFGCGWCNNLFFLKNEGFQSYGIDFSEKAIQHNKPFFGNNIKCCNGTNIPFENDFFDFCIDRSAIQNNSKEDIFSIYKELYRVLKKNGRLYSVLQKKGHFGVQTTTLEESELKQAIKMFKINEINYLSSTINNVSEEYISYLIDVIK